VSAAIFHRIILFEWLVETGNWYGDVVFVLLMKETSGKLVNTSKRCFLSVQGYPHQVKSISRAMATGTAACTKLSLPRLFISPAFQ
jgi:hypothetical protein